MYIYTCIYICISDTCQKHEKKFTEKLNIIVTGHSGDVDKNSIHVFVLIDSKGIFCTIPALKEDFLSDVDTNPLKEEKLYLNNYSKMKSPHDGL